MKSAREISENKSFKNGISMSLDHQGSCAFAFVATVSMNSDSSKVFLIADGVEEIVR